MMPPVGWKVRSFSVINERSTASRRASAGPSQWQRLAHSCHHEIVRSMLSTRSGTKCGVRCERWYDKVKGTTVPGCTLKRAVVLSSWPSSSMGVCSSTASGPAMALRP
ncbi:hypothetical protein D9M69_716050 [compost metagenome]